MTPALSIVIVSYNSRDDLERCLPTIERQDFKDYEIIVVDNAQGDGTSQWLKRRYPSVTVIPNEANTGYAGGNNLGIRHATGEHVLILNPDTELHDGALATMVHAVREHPDALVTPKLLNPDGTVNACGNEMHYTGITSCRGMGMASEAFAGLQPAPLVSGAAFIVRRDLLHDLGAFDERFFMYHEDTDLSLRARSRGHRILCIADAVVTHHYELQMSPTKLYYLERNRLLTLLNNLEAQTLIRLGLPLLLTELATWIFALLSGPHYLLARARGYAWLWRERRAWTTARATAQARRSVADAILLAVSTPDLPFEQLTNPQIGRLLSAVTSPVFRLLRPRLATA